MSSSSFLWEIWTEISLENEGSSLADPLLLETFQAGKSHRVFDDMNDEDLKSVLAKIKGLLNEPRNREKGASVFNEFVMSVDGRRLLGLQDTLLSALRLVYNEKYLRSHIVQGALVNFLPKCKNLPDVLKELTPKNAFVSKIVISCCEEIQNLDGKQPSSEVLKLLEVCLKNFRGTCGNFRDRLENTLTPFLDYDNGDLVRRICDIFPLLSQIGGGGSKGDNHSKDWLLMVRKLLNECYQCLYLLYSDCSSMDDENPFILPSSETVFLPIEERKVFQRIAKIKKRLVNLVQTICRYLRKPFPGPKPVPTRSLLKMISLLISVNPVELLESQKIGKRKEVLFLAALVPSIHSSAFKLLDNLILCLGTNILPDSVAVEQLYTQQWRWMDKKRNTFIDLKETTFLSLVRWLSMTRGQISNPRTAKTWAEYFINEAKLERETVELKALNLKSKNKLDSSRPAATMTNGISSNIGSGLDHHSFVNKSPKVCELALDVLNKINPYLDASLHKNVYTMIAKTHVEVYQNGSSFPGPYESINCRLKLIESLLGLALNPHSRSNISLGLIINLLRTSVLDPVCKVSKFSSAAISNLERIVHPTSQPLDIPLYGVDQNEPVSTVDQSSAILNSLIRNNVASSVEANLTHVVEVDTVDSGCQTDEKLNDAENSEMVISDTEEDVAKVQGFNKIRTDFKKIFTDLKSEIMEEITKNLAEKIISPQSTSNSSQLEISTNTHSLVPEVEKLISESPNTNNKRQLIDNNNTEDIIIDPPLKKSKGTEEPITNSQSEIPIIATFEKPEVEPTSEELLNMLDDFVDV